ncbi:TlpA family protein disulfide reductase [Pseudonocardia sp. TRM90224]|uniref:TlpA family protein disulfide reductase n=1 Tax=Pseudonocardia sp. TRM90224 TaxID=2812678 RepID=UPI001E5BC4CC|nr:TlpA disulfide reductase family protein [Pseudonocardia sp. TRM90224]
MTNRLGAHRTEIISTVVVLLLVIGAVVALWPRGSGATSERALAEPATASESELAPLRAAAQLEPCPTPAAAGAAASAPTGSLAGITVPCLGAPGTVDIGAALAGRPALLNVWASWCAPCRAELPALAEYAARPGAVPVLGINVRDDQRAALQLVTELGVRLPAVTDPDAQLRSALRVPPGLPMSYVVRADGSVVQVDPPIPFASADDVAAAVERLT